MQTMVEAQRRKRVRRKVVVEKKIYTHYQGGLELLGTTVHQKRELETESWNGQ